MNETKFNSIFGDITGFKNLLVDAFKKLGGYLAVYDDNNLSNEAKAAVLNASKTAVNTASSALDDTLKNLFEKFSKLCKQLETYFKNQLSRNE